MKMLREHTQDDGEKVVAFGRYKAWMFKEVPQGYLDWAVKEVKQNPNASEDLRQLASYAQAKVVKEKDEDEVDKKGLRTPKMVARAGRDPEEVAVVTPPHLEVKSWSSASEVSGATSGYRRQRITRKSEARGPTETMAVDMSAEDLEEMQNLRTRLAVLQQKNNLDPEHGIATGSKGQ